MNLKWMEESSYERATKKEKKFARKYGGKEQPCSGRMDFAKGDVKLDEFLFELKFTNSKQYVLKVDTLDKISNEAMSIGKNSAMLIDFHTYGEQYVIIKESVFKALIS